MNSRTRFPQPIELMLAEAEILAKLYQVPTEAVLVHTLAMASAVVGHLVTFRSAGNKGETRATFPLAVITPDTAMPDWIGDQWQTLQQQADAAETSERLFRSPAAIAEQRRMNRVMDLLNPHRNHIDSWLAETIVRSSNHKSFGQVIVISGRRISSPKQKQRPATRLATGLRLFRPSLRTLAKDSEATTATSPNHIAWLQKRDLRTLAREEGLPVLGKLGTVIGCGPATQPADQETQVPQMAALILRILSLAKFPNGRFNFRPSATVAESLDAETAKIREILNKVPACLKEHLVPEPRLAWHLSAILAAMCARQDDEDSGHPAAVVGVMLAAWAVRSHIHHIRQAFPADKEGLFEGRDLTIYRLLGHFPVPVRRLQRSLRGVCRDECLLSLNRAVSAGLAKETSAGHFAAGSGPELEMSDFRSDQTTKRTPTLDSSPKSPDTTDKSRP